MLIGTPFNAPSDVPYRDFAEMKTRPCSILILWTFRQVERQGRVRILRVTALPDRKALIARGGGVSDTLNAKAVGRFGIKSRLASGFFVPRTRRSPLHPALSDAQTNMPDWKSPAVIAKAARASAAAPPS